jgi:hypothetical protein
MRGEPEVGMTSGAALGLAALALVAGGCASTGTGGRDAADLGEARFAIAKAISDTARAVTDFGRTTDPTTVLRFYAPEYDGVQDGDRQTRQDVERVLGDLKQQIAGGAPIQLAARPTNIRVEMQSPTSGWASYDLAFAIAAGDRVAVRQQARCTSLYEKRGEAWLVRHEHCSTQRQRGVPG